MYRTIKANKTKIELNKSYDGETIENKVRRIMSSKEPIKDGAPLIYTDRSEGVVAATDIRTDRFEIAIEAMDKVSKTHLAQREKRMKERVEKNNGIETKTDGSGTSSAPATDNA